MTQIRERFIEQMGVIFQADGLPRISGRLVGLMVFDGKPWSFGELAIELQVSRGSISTNTKLMEQFGIIERVAKPGDRQDYFQLSDDPYVNILNAALARVSKAQDTVHKTATALPKRGHKELKQRLGDFESFYGTVVGALSDAIERNR